MSSPALHTLNGAALVTVDVARVLELVMVVTVTVVLARRFRALRAGSTGRSLAGYATLSVVIASGFFTVTDTRPIAARIYEKALLCLLLAVPYLFASMAVGINGNRRRLTRFLKVSLVADIIITLAIPQLPQPGIPRPTWVSLYIIFILVIWTAQSVVASWVFWVSGRSQPAVIRKRMQTMGAGTMTLAIALIAAGTTSSSQPTGQVVVTTLVGLASIVLLVIAFLMPAPLRAVWRQADELKLVAAEHALMTASTITEIGTAMAPAVAGSLGGQGAALLDREGRVLANAGVDLADVVLIPLQRGNSTSQPWRVKDGLVCLDLTDARLLVQSGPMTPAFGSSEHVQLQRAGNLIDLALQRVKLFEAERASRHDAEAANQELQTLLYSVSHDLRSPLISVLGYIDCVNEDFGPLLPQGSEHYIERIALNANYMHALIGDLLELSRIGRVNSPSADLDLRALVASVAEGLALSYPKGQVTVLGSGLPRVSLNDTRARQLITNLVENALKHGGFEDLAVTIGGEVHEDGSAHLTVSDNGQGIPEEYREKVFQAFERLDAGTRGTTGTGMGLTICRRIADTLGGSLTIAETTAGAERPGACFRFDIPAGLVSTQLATDSNPAAHPAHV